MPMDRPITGSKVRGTLVQGPAEGRSSVGASIAGHKNTMVSMGGRVDEERR